MLALPHHVYAAEVNGGLIFLDLKKNSYDYLAPPDAAEVLCLCNSEIIARDSSQECSSGNQVIEELKKRGLMIESKGSSELSATSRNIVLRELPRLIGQDRPRLNVTHAWNFLRSYLPSGLMATDESVR